MTSSAALAQDGAHSGGTLAPAVLRNLALAAGCGAPPAMQMAVALMSEAPESIEAALAFIADAARHITDVSRRATAPRALAEIEPELQFSPELARVRPDVGDHELRGKLLFRDLVGRQSFFQVAALAIAGLELSAADAELLEHLGVNTQLLDVGIWPLAVSRRVAARAGFLNATVAGLATLLNPNMAVRPVGGFMQFLDGLERAIERGRSLDEQLCQVTQRREKVPGVGRPVLGPDERNAQVVELVARFGRNSGRSWQLARQVDDFFQRQKNQHVNSAGLQGAIMRDMGFSPKAAVAMCVLYFIVPVLAHAVFADERATSARAAESD